MEETGKTLPSHGVDVSTPLTMDFVSYSETVPAILDALGAGQVLARQKQVLLKPNLVNASPPPVTTPVECCEAVATYVKKHSNASVVIAEGCGAADYETCTAFDKLGYSAFSKRSGIPLLDLNNAPVVVRSRDDCRIFGEMRLPAIAFESYIISIPVLKAHSLAEITGTMKNMMGFAPPAYYQSGGHWKKSAFHQDVHQAILELNRYVTPHLTLFDATIGLAEYHLGGAECDPRVNKLMAGFDPVSTDRKAADLLGLDWRGIPHLL